MALSCLWVWFQPPSTWQPSIAPAAPPTGTPIQRPSPRDKAAPAALPRSPPRMLPSMQLLSSTVGALDEYLGAECMRAEGFERHGISTFSVQWRTCPGLSWVPGTYSSRYSSRKHCELVENPGCYIVSAKSGAPTDHQSGRANRAEIKRFTTTPRRLKNPASKKVWDQVRICYIRSPKRRL